MQKKLQYSVLFVILILNSLVTNPTHAQTRNRIAITSGISSNEVFQSARMQGAGSNEGKGANAFGIRYTRNFNNSFSVETGLDYSANKIESTPAFTGQQMPSSQHNIRMVSVPLYGNLTFLKYLFVNAGVIFDLETDKDASKSRGINSQSGVGYGLGAGAKYDFSKVTILVNPFFQKHAVVTTNNHPERIAELGVRMGVGYNF
jgi:opacity protein-like surface antigen